MPSVLTYKLGKPPVIIDSRTFRMSNIRKAMIALPGDFDPDAGKLVVPTPMLANDRLGCCVMSGRGHHTLRMERDELNTIINMRDCDVEVEYFLETDNEDIGLAVLPSLKSWKNKGWLVDGSRYYIRAFAAFDRPEDYSLKLALVSRMGAGLGLQLPITAGWQTDKSMPWSVLTGAGADAELGSWGGHYVACTSYNEVGPICVTWGAYQQMTWEFYLEYSDEGMGITDALDNVDPELISLDAVKELLISVRAA